MATHSVPLPGKPHGQGSLVGCGPWGRKESGTTKQLTLALQHQSDWPCQVMKFCQF